MIHGLVSSVTFADAIRIIILVEIFFTVGWMIARLWKRRHSPWQYLTMMAAAIIAYSIFGAAIMVSRWGHTLSWRAPLLLVAATLAFIAVVREGLKHKEGK